MAGSSGNGPGRDPATGAESTDLLGTAQAGPAAVRGGAIRAGGYAASVLLSTVGAALLFRHLGVEDTGRYVTVLSLMGIAAGLSDAGLTLIGVRELSVQNEPERSRTARNILGLRLLLSTAAIAAATAFAAVAGYDDVLILGTAIAGVGFLIQSVQTTLSISLLSGLRLGLVTAIEMVRQLTSVILIAALVLGGAGLLGFLALPVPAGIVILALTVVAVRGDFPLAPSFDRRQWRSLAGEILPYSLASAAYAMYLRTAIILVSLIATAKETGYFGASFRVVEAMVAVPQLVVGAAFPIFARAARDDHARLAYGLQRVFDACVILGAFTALSVALAAPVAIDLVAGPDFGPSIEILRIQGLAVGASFVAAVWGYAMLSLRLYRETLVTNLIALAVGAGVVATLAALEGARGAAVGTVVAEAVLVAAGAVALARTHRAILPAGRVVWRALVAGGLGVSVALVPGLPPLLALAPAWIIYFGVLHLLGAIPTEALAELRRLRRAPAGSG